MSLTVGELKKYLEGKNDSTKIEMQYLLSVSNLEGCKIDIRGIKSEGLYTTVNMSNDRCILHFQPKLD